MQHVSQKLIPFVSLCLLATAYASPDLAFAQSQTPEQPVVLDLAAGGCQPITEICGDGIDQDCNGSDLLCPGPDQDRDGFTSNDCNDADRNVYPGISVACSAGCGQGTKTCLESGAFSDCSCTPLCEASGDGACYYISRFTGSDTNDGSFNSPWRTFHNINTVAGSGDQPPRKTTLTPGDVVYFMPGTYNDSYNYTSTQRYGFFLRGVNGSTAHPIQIKNYPGAHVVLSREESGSPVFLLQTKNIVFEGFEVFGAGGAGVSLIEVENIELRNLWVHDVDGTDNNNISGIAIKSGVNVSVHHSRLHDNYDRTNADTGGVATENSRNMVLFGGANNRIHHNIIFQSQAISSDKTGGCVTYKHSADISVPDQSFEFDHNILWNCKFNAIGSGSFGSHIHHNLILNSDPIKLADFGGPTHNYNNIVENNTIVNTKALVYNPTLAWGPIGSFTYRDNIVIDESSLYQVTYGMLNIHVYGSDALYDDVVNGGKLTFSNNCYRNSGLPSPQFNLFSRNGGTYGSLGNYYSLSGWQGLGYDTDSVEADPQLDPFFAPMNPSCQNKGWLAP